MTARPSDPAPGSDSHAARAFTWICPYCGESETSRYTESEGEERAVASLRSHVADAEGAGHGPRHELPADRERTLLGYVRLADESG